MRNAEIHALKRLRGGIDDVALHEAKTGSVRTEMEIKSMRKYQKCGQNGPKSSQNEARGTPEGTEKQQNEEKCAQDGPGEPFSSILC